MLVMSIGLLGVAGLQITGLRGNNAATIRSQATFLTYSIADNMRSNSQAILDGSYDDSDGTAGTTDIDCEETSCNSTTLADYDTKKWKKDLDDLLLLGSGKVCIDSDLTDDTDCDGIGNTYAIRVLWDANRSGSTSDDTPLTISFRP